MEKVWFITGAGRGLGNALAMAALRRGHRVVAGLRQPQSWVDRSERSIAVPLDVTDVGSIESGVEQALARWGRIDVLVNNAGYAALGPFECLDLAEFRQQMETNFFGTLSVTRAVLPSMRARRKGVVLNISSITGLRGGIGISAYAASKFAVEGFSESLALELAPFGIAVCSVEPGLFRTGLFSEPSLHMGNRPIDDYLSLQEQLAARYAQLDGAQKGDPELFGSLLVDLVDRSELPLRLLVGQDAHSMCRQKLDSLTAQLEHSERVAAQTHFGAD